MPYAQIRGRRIYYEVHGTGPTVALLHHGFAGSNMWAEICPSIVEAGYRVFMYDRRGYGRSEPGAGFREFYESDTFVNDSVKDLEALSHKLDLHPFHIVGQCEGGVIGVAYAGMLPSHVSSLVISSTLCFGTTTMAEFNALKFPKSFSDLDPDIRKKMVHWHGKDHAEPLYELARTQGGAYGTEVFDLRPRLSLVTCPALVLYPDRSSLFEVEQGVAMYRNLAKGELAVLPKCGHNTYDQKPIDYARHVLNFFERVASSAGTREADFTVTCLASAPRGAAR